MINRLVAKSVGSFERVKSHMSDYEKPRIDPTTGLKWKQTIAGSPKKKVSQPSRRCVECGKTAKTGKKHCRNCATKLVDEQKAARAKRKAAEEKEKAKKWGKSETSTISIRGVRKNRWRWTYDGPRFLPENYLLEERGEAQP